MLTVSLCKLAQLRRETVAEPEVGLSTERQIDGETRAVANLNHILPITREKVLVISLPMWQFIIR